MNRGKLIVIEGGDGSGKETQTTLLAKALAEEGQKVRRISFPCYESEASALVKMYLAGDFGSRPDSVNPYAASVFYGADRYASFKTDWEKDYNFGAIVLADRYTTSNMVHQGVKLKGKEREEYLAWLSDFEFEKMKLPRPDLVIFLDMPPEIAASFIKARKQKHEGKDIHEADGEYLKRSYAVYQELARKYAWQTIPCSLNGNPRSIGEIHRDVLATFHNLYS